MRSPGKTRGVVGGIRGEEIRDENIRKWMVKLGKRWSGRTIKEIS